MLTKALLKKEFYVYVYLDPVKRGLINMDGINSIMYRISKTKTQMSIEG